MRKIETDEAGRWNQRTQTHGNKASNKINIAPDPSPLTTLQLGQGGSGAPGMEPRDAAH